MSDGSTKRREDEQRTVELIATVSHEIRSPLTTIKGFTKTLLDRWDRLPDDMKLDMLRAINADADRVTRILTELLDVSRLEAGKLSLHLVTGDVRQLASDIAEVLAERSEKHVVTVDDESLELRGDLDKIRQVLTNLIENAQKYSDPGPIEIGFSHEESGTGLVTVTDGGPGVPPEMSERIFEKFARRELPGTPTGTGLGLFICRGLVEAQGGQMGATFDPGKTTFWFRLPLAAPV